jgi:3-methyl-2-oxobutanoate hydroxymethyltransferase
MSTHVATRRLTHLDLAKMRAAGEKIAMLTCYDASFARSATPPASTCCSSATRSAWSCRATIRRCRSRWPTSPTTPLRRARQPAAAGHRRHALRQLPGKPAAGLRNAVTLMAAGAQMVKLEGGVEMAETTRFPDQPRHPGLRPRRPDAAIGAPAGRLPRPGPTTTPAPPAAGRRARPAGGRRHADRPRSHPRSAGRRSHGQARHPDDRHRRQPQCSGQVLVLHDMLDISPGASRASCATSWPASRRSPAPLPPTSRRSRTAASRQPNTATEQPLQRAARQQPGADT